MDAFKAQFGEDRTLAGIFTDKAVGFYIEVGAYDGVDMSNTFYFESIGWRGILIEADPALADQCRLARPRSIVVNCAAVGPGNNPEVTFQVSENCKGLSAIILDNDHLERIQAYTGELKISDIKVPARTLDSILEEHAVNHIDFMSIDVEGFEWDVLQGLQLKRWRPEILLIERNGLFPDPRIMNFLEDNDYTFHHTTGVNDWFWRSPPGAARTFSYRLWMFISYYGPKHLTALQRHLRMLKRKIMGQG